MRFRYLSQCRATKALVSLRKCAGSPELPVLTYTKYGCRWRPRLTCKPLAPLAGCACMFKYWLCSWFRGCYYFIFSNSCWKTSAVITHSTRLVEMFLLGRRHNTCFGKEQELGVFVCFCFENKCLCVALPFYRIIFILSHTSYCVFIKDFLKYHNAVILTHYNITYLVEKCF